MKPAVPLLRRVVTAGALASAVVVLTLAVTHATQYFFLYDDFALIGEARAHAAGTILRDSLFGFYRPLLFATTRIESAWFGWHQPAGYLLVSLGWHVLNAALLFTLTRRIGGTVVAATVAAAVLTISPWAGETYLWFSGRFDVMSAAGVLAAMVSALGVADARTPWGRRVWTTLVAIATCVAVFSKEPGVVTPLLCALAIIVARPRAWRQRGPMMAILAGGSVIVVYLVMRQLALPGFGSAYGSVFTLYLERDVWTNAASLIAAFSAFPLPGTIAGDPLPFVRITGAAVLGLVVLAGAVKAAPRLTAFAVLALLVSLGPVLPFDIDTGSSAEGRYLYLPGAFVAMAIGLAAGASRVMAAASLTIIGVSVWSVSHQVPQWRAATATSREAIEEFRPVLRSGATSVYIPNFPYYLAEGPYVLEDFAFRYYFEGATVPEVRTRNMLLRMSGDQLEFAGWIDPAPESPATPGETVLRLNGIQARER